MVALPSAGFHSVRNLFFAGHPAGKNHGFALGSGIFDERQIHKLKTGDLVGLTVHFLQKIDRGSVKGRREEINSHLLALRLDPRLPLPRRIGFLVEIIEALSVPEPATHHEAFTLTVDGQCIRRVGLDFQAAGSRLPGGMHDFQGILQLPRMVGAHFRDGVDPPLIDGLKQIQHTCSPLPSSDGISSPQCSNRKGDRCPAPPFPAGQKEETLA